MNVRGIVERAEFQVLAVVLLLAFALRAWGGFFGLPHVYHPDEGFEVYRAVRLGMGGFETDRMAKGGYFYLLFVEYGLYFIWSLVTGAVGGAGQFAESFVRDPGPFWKIGRVTTALLGTFTVGLVWWQGRRMGSTRAGLLGAAFLAFSFQHVVDSHFITVDVPMTLFAFWSVVLVVEDVSGRGSLRVRTFAPVAAYAMLCKLPAVVIFVPLLAAAWARGGLAGAGGVFSNKTMKLVGATLAIYCVANPGVVLAFGRFTSSVLAIFTPAAGGEGPDGSVASSPNLWGFYADTLLRSQGPALLALAGIGAVIGAVRRSQGVLLHLSFVVPFFVLIAAAASPHLYYPRYVVPMLPGLCLVAGLALDELVQRIQRAPGPSGLLAAAIALLIVIEPGLAAATWDHRHTRTDTRTQAARWIESNVAHRTRILLEGSPEETAQLSVPLRNTKENILRMIEELRARDPGKATYWEMKVALQERPLYDLVTVRHFEPWGELEDYRAAGVEYVVLRREFFVAGARNGPEKHDENVTASRYRFYVDLVAHRDAERVAFFPAAEDGDPGYDIEVWRLVPPAEDQTLAGADAAEPAG